MTQEQVLREFEALPRDEQEMVAEAIFRHLHGRSLAASQESGKQVRRMAAVKRLQGALKWPGTPPSNEEAKLLRDEYLTRKYQ